MAVMPNMCAPDPTLEAVDSAIQARGDAEQARPYLGMSSIGRECSRALWYDFRWASRSSWPADALKRFEDGHIGEDLQAKRLQMLPAITLYVIDHRTGKQFGHVDHGGHFRGHMDGVILGLIQAPKTWHVWEHKQTDPKKQASLLKLKQDRGEKAALQEWDAVYFGQAQLYMGYAKLDRHYLTCATPGGRHTISVRTNFDQNIFEALKAKALRIITAQTPPEQMSERPDWYQCKWCSHHAICHEQAIPQVTCRTCAHATPELDGDGRWSCAAFGCDLDVQVQRESSGCPNHIFIPELLPWKAVNSGQTGAEAWVEYDKDGTSIINGAQGWLSREIAANVAMIGDPEAAAFRARFQAELIG